MPGAVQTGGSPILCRSSDTWDDKLEWAYGVVVGQSLTAGQAYPARRGSRLPLANLAAGISRAWEGPLLGPALGECRPEETVTASGYEPDTSKRD